MCTKDLMSADGSWAAWIAYMVYDTRITSVKHTMYILVAEFFFYKKTQQKTQQLNTKIYRVCLTDVTLVSYL